MDKKNLNEKKKIQNEEMKKRRMKNQRNQK